MRELLEFNRYAHDFTAAMWVCGSILIFLIWKEATRGGRSEETVQTLRGLCAKISWISVPALIISLLTGGVRALTFRQFEFVGEVTSTLIAALVIKHIVFLAFIVWGVSVHVRARKLGRADRISDMLPGSLREVRL